MEKLYSVSELAEYFGVSEKTIFRHLRSGEMKGFKVGREWNVTESNLKEFMNNQKNKERIDKYELKFRVVDEDYSPSDDVYEDEKINYMSLGVYSSNLKLMLKILDLLQCQEKPDENGNYILYCVYENE